MAWGLHRGKRLRRSLLIVSFSSSSPGRARAEKRLQRSFLIVSFSSSSPGGVGARGGFFGRALLCSSLRPLAACSFLFVSFSSCGRPKSPRAPPSPPFVLALMYRSLLVGCSHIPARAPPLLFLDRIVLYGVAAATFRDANPKPPPATSSRDVFSRRNGRGRTRSRRTAEHRAAAEPPRTAEHGRTRAAASRRKRLNAKKIPQAAEPLNTGKRGGERGERGGPWRRTWPRKSDPRKRSTRPRPSVLTVPRSLRARRTLTATRATTRKTTQPTTQLTTHRNPDAQRAERPTATQPTTRTTTRRTARSAAH